jgi:hypothetical protein
MNFYKTSTTVRYFFAKNITNMKAGVASIILSLIVFSMQGQNEVSTGEVKSQNNKMKEFSFIVRVPLSYSREQATAANTVWVELLSKWKKEEIWIASFPFPADGYLITGKEKVVAPGSVHSNEQKVVSTIFLRAPSIEQAIDLGKTFPVLPYGGSVEVREILPRPASSN